MKTPRSRQSRVATLTAAGALALVGALGVGGATQVLLADTDDVASADDSGSESKPRSNCGYTCEK